MTANGADGDWVAPLPVTLSDTEKRELELTARPCGHVTRFRHSNIYINGLARRGLVAGEQIKRRVFNRTTGEPETALTQGWTYRITPAGVQWLKECHPVEPVEAAAE